MHAPVLPTPHFLSFADLNTPVDCQASDPKGEGRNAVKVYAGGAGTLVVRPIGGTSDGSDDRTLTLTADKDFDIEFELIASGTATNVTVFWSR
jgi:hypothetical protein